MIGLRKIAGMRPSPISLTFATIEDARAHFEAKADAVDIEEDATEPGFYNIAVFKGLNIHLWTAEAA